MAEAEEAEEAAKELGLSNDQGSLERAIMQRQAEREAEADSFFAHLESKYGGKASKGGKKKWGWWKRFRAQNLILKDFYYFCDFIRL